MDGKRYKSWLVRQAQRRAQIKAFHASGKTMAEVAAQFGISRGRAWQIVRNYAK